MKNIFTASLFTLSFLASSVTFANEISPAFIKKEVALAHTQYLQGSTESGLYALKALARILELNTSIALSSKLAPNDLSFTYLRIGLLEEKLGNQSEANEYFQKTLSSYQGAEIEITKLKEVVSRLDAKRS